MTLEDPITAYNAESNMDALWAQQYLENEGIEAHVIEDHSMVGHWMFGNLPEIHKPQVWVSRQDAEEAGRLLAIYEQRKIDRDAGQAAKEVEPLEVVCEECERSSTFAGSLNGTVQDCPHCGAYVDVGEFDWPEDGPSL